MLIFEFNLRGNHMKKTAITLALISLFGLTACNQQPAAAVVAPAQVPKIAAASAPAGYMTVGLTPDAFMGEFNAQAAKHNSGFHIPALNIVDGAGGKQFTFLFDKNIMLLGTLNANDGTIRSLTLTAVSGGTLQGSANIMFMMHDLVATTNPTLSDKQQGKIASELFTSSVEHMDQNIEQVFNGLKYSTVFIKNVGVLFVVNQKLDLP